MLCRVRGSGLAELTLEDSLKLMRVCTIVERFAMVSRVTVCLQAVQSPLVKCEMFVGLWCILLVLKHFGGVMPSQRDALLFGTETDSHFQSRLYETYTIQCTPLFSCFWTRVF